MAVPMTELDRRLHAYREDLADVALEGQVEAERFTEGQPGVVRVGVADLRRAPDPTLGIDTQLLFGETVTVYDVQEGWAWVKNHRDGYVGYLAADTLDGPTGEATHHVAALRTFLYAEPDMKTPVLGALSMTSPLRIVGTRDGYAEVAGAGWVFAAHVAPRDTHASDHVATALAFRGLPYRWGGKASVGLDCSALVQMVLHRAGHACPRDSDMQADTVGVLVEDEGDIERGDLLYLPGHVAIALDDETVVHATANSMDVCVEPLGAVVERALAESGRGLTAIRRL